MTKTRMLRVGAALGTALALFGAACSEGPPSAPITKWQAPAYGGRWGAEGEGPGEFRSPTDCAVAPNGNVYVADYGNERVQYFTATGSLLGGWQFDRRSAEGNTRPWSVAVSPEGTVYLSDYAHAEIEKYTPTGSLLGRWGNPGAGDGEFNGPRGLALAPDGTVYVADYRNNRIQRFTASGSFLGKWGSYGPDAGEFRGPYDVAVGGDGTVYVVDRLNSRLQYFTPAGSLLGWWGAAGAEEGQFNLATGVAASPRGPVFVAEAGEEHKIGNDRLQAFTRLGVYLGGWGRHGSGPLQFNNPHGLAAAADGTVYVADTDNHRLVYYR